MRNNNNKPEETLSLKNQIIVVDTSVQNWQSLVAGVGPDVQVIQLDPARDGLAQIAEALQSRHDIGALHIVSHGAEGTLHLGSTVLDGDNLEEHQSLLAQIGHSLTASGDILLYGCNVAAGDSGQTFIEHLAAATGADVAASNDPTGSSALGGDWSLEFASGIVETPTLGPTYDFQGLLAAPTLVKASMFLDSGSTLWRFVNVDGTLYFVAYDGIRGEELWKSNGTEAGTAPVESTAFGGSSSPIYLTNINGTLYFAASDAISGSELWKSDGTEAGTVRIKDIRPGTVSSNPSGLANVNGTLYFVADDGTSGAELWKSDGTEAGTVLVKDIYPTGYSGNSNPSNFTNVNGALYFTAAYPFNGTELWKSDGTTAGTVLVRDIVAGVNGSSPANLTNIDGTLYFTATDPTNGTELWKSDGTETGTIRVKDIYAGTIGSSPASLTNVNDTLYFAASDAAGGTELWKSDGTEAGTVRVKDIYSGVNGSSTTNLTNVNGTLYFTASNGTSGIELWKSDGTEAGTVRVKDIVAGAGGSSPTNLTNVNGTLYFSASDGTSGQELWKSDGTEAGTIRVEDIYPGTVGSDPGYLTDVNGTLYFRANNGTNGMELWRSDGTDTGTSQVRNIAIVGSGPDSYTGPANIGQTLYFVTKDSTSGAELWKSDGTEAGTARVKDIASGTYSSGPSDLSDVNGTLFFTAASGSDRELWKTDGTEAGTVRVKDIRPGGSSGVETGYCYLTNVNDTLYFRANDGTSGSELWKSDGTEAGTVRVKDIAPGATSGGATGITNVNGTLFFAASDGTSGGELWKSDGTEAGTVRVKDIVTGSNSSGPEGLTDVNGTLFFTAQDGYGRELWKSDGSEAGTVRVKDINLGTSSTPINLTNVNGTLYFVADDGTTGQELWKSDGTEIGTVRVKDIVPGVGNSTPNSLTNVNGALYFLATDATHGTELWKSDGTDAGTVLIKDIWPGTLSSNVQSLTSFNGMLYFVADDGINGPKLWQSDGTETGTIPVPSTEQCGAPAGLFNADGILYFGAYDANSQSRGLWTIGGTQANQPPVLTGPQASLAATDEDVAVTLTATALLQGFTDPNGDALSVANLTADHGTIAANGVDSWLFTPAPNYNGVVSFTYNVNDGKGGSTSAILGLTVTPVNDAPVVANALPDQGTTQGAAFSYTVPANTFSDVDGDSLTLGASLADGNPLPAWLGFNATNGSFSGTPAQGDIGMITVRVTATDGTSVAAADEFLLTVGTVSDTYNKIIGTDYDDLLTGSESEDWITALAGSDTIYAYGGNDIVDGGTDADTMYGGHGDDLYVVDNINDHVIENGDEGVDEVESSVSYTLGNYVENLTLTGAANVNATGNELDNLLIGNPGDNGLDGGIGDDTLLGGIGNDVYYVDSDFDVVIENYNEGVDEVRSYNVSYSLGDNLENLTLFGDYDVNGTGNALNNILVGNAFSNVLDGGAGDDVMTGGAYHDRYFVDTAGDQVIENLDEGTDTVESSISYTLGDNIENLVLLGSEDLYGTGNTTSNVIHGNAGNNIIDGGIGGDILLGRTGNDIYFVDSSTDYVIEKLNEGIDEVNSSINYTLTVNVENLTLIGSNSINGTGNELGNILAGNSSDNILDGGTGEDTVVFSGNRSDYTITSNGSTYTVTDTRTGSPDGTDTATGVENFQFAGGTTFTTGAGGTLDITSPAVTAVAYGTNDGTLKAGETVTLAVTFSENVTVAGGTPSLLLDTGGTATLSGGSGTNQLSFTYTVAGGQNSADLEVSAFNLNGATVKDAQGNDADTTGAVTNPDGILVVDTMPLNAPTISQVTDDVSPVMRTVASGGSTNDNTPTVRVSLSDTGASAGNSVQLFNGTTALGAAVTLTSSDITAGFTEITPSALSDGSYAFNAKITDTVGNTSAPSTVFNVTVDTAAPTALVSITAIADDTGTPGDFTTSDTSLTVSGTNGALGGGEKVQVSSDGGSTWADAIVSTTTWSYVDPVTHSSNFTYQARVVDGAGNIGNTANQAIILSTSGLIINGTSGADFLVGTNGDDTINGLGGDDTINGFVGADRVNGGAGNDTIVLTATSTDLNTATNTQIVNVEVVSAAGAATGVIINLHNQTENLTIIGSGNNDTITGNTGNNTINAGGGDDTIVGFVGTDRIDGEGGTDMIVLTATSAALNSANNRSIVNIEAVSAASAGSGVIIDVSNQNEGFMITGSTFGDTIIGGDGNDAVLGFVGMDRIDGGGGTDMIVLTTTSADLNSAGNFRIVNVEAVSAASAESGVIIDLSNQNEGFRITGSAFGDTITGSKGDDDIRGGNANDILNGGNGADRITGGNGVDAIDLGFDNKADHVVFNILSEFGDTISNFDIAHDSIDFGAALKSLLDDGFNRGDIAWGTSATGNNSNTAVNLNNLEALYEAGTANDGVLVGNLTNSSAVATEFNAEFNISVTNGESTLLVINDNTADSNQTAVWLYTEAGGAEIQGNELQLIGMVNANGSMTPNDFHFV